MPDPTTEIHPDAFYTAKDLAERWNLSSPNSIYDIPEEELPRTRVGPRRGRINFRGRHIIRYERAGQSDAVPETELAVLENQHQTSGVRPLWDHHDEDEEEASGAGDGTPAA